MTYILVTNDDGVGAPGIAALVEALRPLGEIRVSAPADNQSASGHKKTLFQDIPIRETIIAGDTPALAVGGSPADCIALAAMGLTKWPPSLIVSGINRGENLGQDVAYSGTVSAAMEAVIQGIPGLAVSLANHDAHDPADYAQAGQLALRIARRILKYGLPPLTILSLNVPAGPVRGIRVARQGVRIYRDELEIDDGVVRIAGEPPTGILDEMGTDIWAVHNQYASITPLHLDMTAHQFMADLMSWDVNDPE